MTFTILSLALSYALVVAFLTYLLLLSRLHWVFKALATIATVLLIPLNFRGVGELRGLPSDGPIPSNFMLLWAQVVEPNLLHGEHGHVYLWLQTLDELNYPIGQPRAYQLPYSDDLKFKLSEAMGSISQGEEVQGAIDAEEALPENTSEALAIEVELGAADARPDGSGSVGERVFSFEPSMLSFGTAQAPVTPSKPP